MMTELTAPCNKGNFIPIIHPPAPAATIALLEHSSVRQGTPFQLTEATSELPRMPFRETTCGTQRLPTSLPGRKIDNSHISESRDATPISQAPASSAGIDIDPLSVTAISYCVSADEVDEFVRAGSEMI